jgi:putative addiction module antidote
MKLKLRSIGTSTGIILPKQLLDRLKLKKDDVLFASETPEGYHLTPYDPEVERQVKLGLEIMKEYREVFRALANE